jgi:acyl-CoA reductase-like NAD-dependent aldehyde dehydrogenase
VFGQWLIDNARQAQVYAELAGVNNIVIDSTDAYKAMLGTLSLYSGQMCTTSQAIFVPAGGIETEDGHKSYDEFCADLAKAVQRFLSKPEVAHAVLGAIQSADTAERIEWPTAARWARSCWPPPPGQPRLPGRQRAHPGAAGLRRRRRKAYMEERFGPISFIVKVADTAAAIALSERVVSTHGALTAGVYSTSRRHRRDDRSHLAQQGRPVDQPHRRRLRQSVGGLLRLPRHRRQPGGQRLLRGFGLRRQPLPRRPAPLPRLRTRHGLQEHPFTRRASPA